MPATDLERTPSKSQLRWFGLVVLAFFALVGALLQWQFQLLLAAQILWGTGVSLALLYYWVRPLQLPLYLLWMRAVAPIGWLVSHLVLAAIYYLVITPIAIVMRTFGRDQLRLRFDASARSYWKEHDPAADTARYFRQS